MLSRASVHQGAIDVAVLPEGAPDYGRVVQRTLGDGQTARDATLPSTAGGPFEQPNPCRTVVFGVFSAQRLTGGACALESPGGTVLIALQPDELSRPEETEQLLLAIKSYYAGRSELMLQALLEPHEREHARALGSTGFTYLARLQYLQRDCALPPPPCRASTELEWVSFSTEHRPLFLAALERSYEETLDCPKLRGLRSTESILRGHEASGPHDGHMWWVARHGEEPVGIILLTYVPHRNAIEIVYVGVSLGWRGAGNADALMRRAVDVGSARRAQHLTLAVDSGNVPARRLYARWGFTPFAARDAWIATSCPQSS